MHHDLKVLPEFFSSSYQLIKPFEIRFNDRNYQVNDTITLREFTVFGKYTGRTLSGVITYITDFNQVRDYVVFAYKVTDVSL
jgi:Domain of unknown function (DUF3850)